MQWHCSLLANELCKLRLGVSELSGVNRLVLCSRVLQAYFIYGRDNSFSLGLWHEGFKIFSKCVSLKVNWFKENY